MMMMMITWNKWNDITQIQKPTSHPTKHSPPADGQHGSHSLANISRTFSWLRFMLHGEHEIT